MTEKRVVIGPLGRMFFEATLLRQVGSRFEHLMDTIVQEATDEEWAELEALSTQVDRWLVDNDYGTPSQVENWLAEAEHRQPRMHALMDLKELKRTGRMLAAEFRERKIPCRSLFVEFNFREGTMHLARGETKEAGEFLWSTGHGYDTEHEFVRLLRWLYETRGIPVIVDPTRCDPDLEFDE